jgi:hypothetical protein
MAHWDTWEHECNVTTPAHWDAWDDECLAPPQCVCLERGEPLLDRAISIKSPLPPLDPKRKRPPPPYPGATSKAKPMARSPPSPTPDAPAGSAFAYQPGPTAEGEGVQKDKVTDDTANSAADLPPLCLMVDRETMGWPSDENWERVKHNMTFGVQAMLTDMDDIVNDETDAAPNRKEMAYDYVDYIPSDAEKADPNVWCHIVPPEAAGASMTRNKWIRVKARLHKWYDNMLLDGDFFADMSEAQILSLANVQRRVDEGW